MNPEEFRAAGHQLIDWIADFRTRLPTLPVRSPAAPGEVRRRLPVEPPTGTVPFDQLLSDLDEVVMPGMTHFQHPAFYGFFPANASLSSVLGDLASGGLGALGITWQANPALTEVEEVMCDWMRQLVGLSTDWRGTIFDTASTGGLVALMAARERASRFSMREGGLQALPSPLVVYTTEEAHSSIPKAALLAGFGDDNIRLVEVDRSTFAMDPAALGAAIKEDIAAGRKPAVVVATVGTTATTAIDPVKAIAAVGRSNDLWVHVDAAMAGTAMLLPECRWMWEGVDDADSLVWNPHKWMGTVFDCSLFYVKDPAHLVGVFSSNPSYVRAAVDGQVTQYRDWGIPFGRRFRALKLWFQLELDGVESIKERVRRDLAGAQWLKEAAEATPEWRVLAPVPLQTVCLRHEPTGRSSDEVDAHTLSWVEAVNKSGQAYLTPARLDGQWMVRVSIGSLTTERSDLEALWGLMRSAAEAQ
jgi:aromatic-L-amino-acid decarboxylase